MRREKVERMIDRYRTIANRYRKIISLLLISMMFLLPACRRTELSHLVEHAQEDVKADIKPQEHAKECVCVENKKNKRHVFLLISTSLAAFGFLIVGVIHDLYYKDGHWMPHLIPNRVPA
jgi:hypothetical protein